MMRKILGFFYFFCSFYLIFPQACLSSEEFSLNLPEIYKLHCDKVVKVKYQQENGSQITSGFFVSENGYVLTSVIGGREFVIETVSGQRFSADVMGEDATTSICLLKANIGNARVPFFSLMRSGVYPSIGAMVAGLSCEYGLGVAPHMGYVTGFNHNCFGNDWPMTLMRTTIRMEGGSCGGAIVGSDGQLQGMLLHALEGSNQSFSMPLCGLCKVFQDLLVFGRVRYSYVGLSTQTVFDNKCKELRLQVLKVTPVSPADKAGFKEKDILLKLNGDKVDSLDFFKNFMFLSSPNEQCNIEILRDDKIHTLTLYLGEKM